VATVTVDILCVFLFLERRRSKRIKVTRFGARVGSAAHRGVRRCRDRASTADPQSRRASPHRSPCVIDQLRYPQFRTAPIANWPPPEKTTRISKDFSHQLNAK
jgi:hypothetical protein